MPSSAIARQWDFNVPVAGFAINRHGDYVAVALGDGSLRLLPAHIDVEQPQELNLHKGVSLSLQPDADGHAFLSGGDDGRVYIVDPAIAAPTLLVEHKNKWIDHVAGSADGQFRAYSFGKEVRLLNAEGAEAAPPLMHPSSIGGLAFSPNSKRLAASHYNGVSLWWTKAKENVPMVLEWKGSHLNTLWSPDGKNILTSLQEGALHGWRMADMNEMRMQGYGAKIHSMDFTTKGRYLATSGAMEIVCWPFFGGGPWGKQPLTIGGRDSRLVSRVAPHPTDDMIAAGYDDGMVILAPMDGRPEIMIHPPVGTNITGLGWNKEGDCLFAALENGTVLLFTMDSVRRFVKNA